MSASTDTGGAISFRTGGRNLEPVVLGTAGIVGLLVIWQAIASFSGDSPLFLSFAGRRRARCI